MHRVAIIRDDRVTPPPLYGPLDVEQALAGTSVQTELINLDQLERKNRADVDVIVLPYLYGPVHDTCMEHVLRLHAAGTGILILGDTPSDGPAYPFRNSRAPDFRLTKCRDDLILRGLTAAGTNLFGALPGLDSMTGRRVGCVRTTAFPPDECSVLVRASDHLKDMGPVVLIERRHPRFVGARMAVVGFDGGAPRENIMGVCERPWTPDFGMLDRNWPGIDPMVRSLVEAVAPGHLGLALEFDPVVQTGDTMSPVLRIRNLSEHEQAIAYTCHTQPVGLLNVQQTRKLPPFSTACIPLPPFPAPLGATIMHAELTNQDGTTRLKEHSRTLFAGEHARPGCLGFSTYRAFRHRAVDDAFRDFIHHTARLGMHYIRMALPWEDLEPEPGVYQWDLADQMVEAAAAEGLSVMLWVFPTTRGSGLGDGGLPVWALHEPSIDRHGKPGNFPCIWSPFYRKHYFDFLEALTRRYAHDDRVSRFIYDFGNSDFAYTYHYYGDRGDLFDYSPHEQKAFSAWLDKNAVPLTDISRRWGQTFQRYDEVPVPYAEQTGAWLLYDRFRVWGVHQGIKAAAAIIERCAPDKAPPDHPGHGLGSIADIQTYIHYAQARHWPEIMHQPAHLVEAHNMGPVWGGEAWQVGGTYADYDDALFQSVRLEADYLTIPGPDLGLREEDLGRIAMIRHTLSRARRETPKIAIMDHIAWDQFASLAQLGTRLDQPVDLISHTCRYDYRCYDLLFLPPDEQRTTEKGTTSLLPLDEDFYHNILRAVEQGLRVVIFPHTGRRAPGNPMRSIFELHDIGYGEPVTVDVAFPASWGGGQGRGRAVPVTGGIKDELLLTSTRGDPLCIYRPRGKGGFILCGFDNAPESLDAAFGYNRSPDIKHHTLARLIRHAGLSDSRITSGQACCYKEWLSDGQRDYLLLFSHQPGPLKLDLGYRCSYPCTSFYDLGDGATYPVCRNEDGNNITVNLTILPQRGYYLVAV